MYDGSGTSIMQLRSRHRRRACRRVRPSPVAVVLLGLTSWLACDGVVEPLTDPAVEVQVTPAGTSISGVGATATFRVVAWDANGDTITSPETTWSSLNQHVATIDESGTATAVGSGQVTIAAEVDAAVGYALLTVSTPEVGTVTSWSIEHPAAWPLNGVWGTSSSDLFAVGMIGTILHYEGTEWSDMTSGTTQGLYAVWGTSSSDVYAVGTYGVILHYDGTQWSEMTCRKNYGHYSVQGN